MSAAATVSESRSDSTNHRRSGADFGTNLAMAVCSFSDEQWIQVTRVLKEKLSHTKSAMEVAVEPFIEECYAAGFSFSPCGSLQGSPRIEDVNRWHMETTGKLLIESAATSSGEKQNATASSLASRETKVRHTLRASQSDPDIRNSGSASPAEYERRFTAEYLKLLRELTDMCKHIIRERSDGRTPRCYGCGQPWSSSSSIEDVDFLFNLRRDELCPISKLRFAMAVIHVYEHCSYQNYKDLHDTAVIRRHLWRVQQRDSEYWEGGPVLFCTEKQSPPPVEHMLIVSDSGSDAAADMTMEYQQQLPPGHLFQSQQYIKDEISERNSLKHWRSSNYGPATATHKQEAAVVEKSNSGEDDDVDQQTTDSQLPPKRERYYRHRRRGLGGRRANSSH